MGWPSGPVLTSRLGAIAGIDRGTINIANTNTTTTATATVTAVVTARSLLSNLGQKNTGATLSDTDDSARRGSLVLTNTTTITFDIGAATTNAQNTTVSYELVEYGA